MPGTVDLFLPAELPEPTGAPPLRSPASPHRIPSHSSVSGPSRPSGSGFEIDLPPPLSDGPPLGRLSSLWVPPCLPYADPCECPLKGVSLPPPPRMLAPVVCLPVLPPPSPPWPAGLWPAESVSGEDPGLPVGPDPVAPGADVSGDGSPLARTGGRAGVDGRLRQARALIGRQPSCPRVACVPLFHPIPPAGA